MFMCGRDEKAIPKGPAHGQTPPPHLSGSFNLDVNMRCQTAPTMGQVTDPHTGTHTYINTVCTALDFLFLHRI